MRFLRLQSSTNNNIYFESYSLLVHEEIITNFRLHNTSTRILLLILSIFSCKNLDVLRDNC